MLTMITTSFIYMILILKLSISQIRCVTIVLGSLTIFSVLICVMASYFHSHRRPLTFPEGIQPLQKANTKYQVKVFCKETFDSNAVQPNK